MIITGNRYNPVRAALMAVILIATIFCSSCKGKDESIKTESMVPGSAVSQNTFSESTGVNGSGLEKDFENVSVETIADDLWKNESEDKTNGITTGYGNNIQDGSIDTERNSSVPGTLNDFSWYFEDDFPIDGNVLTELQDLGGNWKGLINVVTPVDGEDQCRMMVGDVEVQYMGYKVTLLVTPRERYEFMVSAPDNIKTLETVPDASAMVMEGDWNEEIGEIDAETEGGLRVVIIDFVEAGGVSYALGSVYNRDKAIGEIAMFR